MLWLLVLLVSLFCRLATASEPTAAAAPMKTPRSGYGLVLGAAHVVAPLLALAAGQSVFEATDSEGATAAAVGLSFLLPTAIHVAYGEPTRGASGFFTMLGYTALGVGVGGVSGFALAQVTCDDSAESDCYIDEIELTIGGLVLGGVVGYGVHAVLDVIEVGKERPPEGERAARVVPWLRPKPARVADADATRRALAGVEVGVTYTW